MNKTTYEQELQEKGKLIYTTVGRSMRPFLRSGEDLMEITAGDGSRYRKYDVVLYRRKSGKYVLHRIVRVRPEDYVLCGDNCHELEPGIRDDQILGVLTGLIRDGKSVNIDAPGYRLCVRLWCLGFPVRAVVIRLRRLIGAIWKRIKKAGS